MSYFVTKALSSSKIGEVVPVERKEITNIIVTGNDIQISRPESVVRIYGRSYKVNYREREYYNVSKNRLNMLLKVINGIKYKDKRITLMDNGFAVELNW